MEEVKKVNKTEDMKEYQRIYRLANKENMAEYMREYMKEYYQKNKNKIGKANADRKLKTLTCDCGCIVARYNLEKHKRSKKHNKKMESQQ